jgi:hypothetical protein
VEPTGRGRAMERVTGGVNIIDQGMLYAWMKLE